MRREFKYRWTPPRFGYRFDGQRIVEEAWRKDVVGDILTLTARGETIRGTVHRLSRKYGRPFSFSSVQRTLKREGVQSGR